MDYNFNNPYMTTPMNTYAPNYAGAPTYPRVVPQNQNASQNNTFQWVQGRAGAEAYLVAPGASVILMDSNAPVIYFKSADNTGRYLPMKTYDLVERAESVPEQNPLVDAKSFVKREEIDSLVAKAVENYLNTPSKKGE